MSPGKGLWEMKSGMECSQAKLMDGTMRLNVLRNQYYTSVKECGANQRQSVLTLTQTPSHESELESE